MFKFIKNIRRRLATKLILTVGLTLLITISTWAYFNINYQEKSSWRILSQEPIG